MADFQELISKRRTIRKYSEQPLSTEQVQLILTAGLKSPTSKNAKSWQFIVIEKKEQLEALSKLKKSAPKIVSNCAVAIVILGDPIKSNVWIEDASIAATMIQLQAEDLGLGSCWIQVRGRETEFGVDSEEYIKDLFDVPMHLRVLTVITIGNKAENKEPRSEDNLPWEKIHIDTYRIE